MTAAHASHICCSRAYAHPVLLWSSRAVGMDGPSRFAFPPNSCWRTLNVGNPSSSRSPATLVVFSLTLLCACRLPLSLRRFPTRLCITSLSPAPPHAPTVSLFSFSGAAPCASVLPIRIYISTVAKYVHSGVVYCLMECGHAFSYTHARQL